MKCVLRYLEQVAEVLAGDPLQLAAFKETLKRCKARSISAAAAHQQVCTKLMSLLNINVTGVPVLRTTYVKQLPVSCIPSTSQAPIDVRESVV